jgi:fructokinase
VLCNCLYIEQLLSTFPPRIRAEVGDPPINSVCSYYPFSFTLASGFDFCDDAMATGAEMAPIVTFGELLIDFVPTVAGLSLSDTPAFKKAPGGAPANVAVGVCRLGGHAAFIGKVGEDEFGIMLKKVLEDNGVDVKGVVLDSNARTALAFVTLREDGEREFMFYRNPSADMLMLPSELDEGLIRGSTVFHYGSISLISEPSRSTHRVAMNIAKQSHSLLSYDPNLRLPLWPSPELARDGIMSIWDEADIVKVSDEEVKFLTNGKDEQLDATVLELWRPNMKLLLVTDGPDGCRYYTPTFRGRVESFQVTATPGSVLHRCGSSFSD